MDILRVDTCMRFLEVHLLEHRADACLTLLEIAKLISKVIISICSPRSSVCELQVPHNLANSWYC